MDLENSSSLSVEDRRRESMSSNGLGDGEDTFWRMRASEVGVKTPDKGQIIALLLCFNG